MASPAELKIRNSRGASCPAQDANTNKHNAIKSFFISISFSPVLSLFSDIQGSSGGPSCLFSLFSFFSLWYAAGTKSALSYSFGNGKASTFTGLWSKGFFYGWRFLYTKMPAVTSWGMPKYFLSISKTKKLWKKTKAFLMVAGGGFEPPTFRL